MLRVIVSFYLLNKIVIESNVLIFAGQLFANVTTAFYFPYFIFPKPSFCYD